jgi:hypothetical protein
MPRDREPMGTTQANRRIRRGRIVRTPGPLGTAAAQAWPARYSGGWMRFNGFQLIWYDSSYPSTQRVGYITRAQSGQNIKVEVLGIAQDAVQRPFTDSRLKDVGPIPEGQYDLLIADAGPARLIPGYRRERGDNGVVTDVWRWMVGIRGMQRIQDDLQYTLDNPRTPDVDESSRQVEVWGKYRARIVPRHGTQMFGRGGFYLHSSRKMAGTHGCIETLGDETIFLRLMQVRERYRLHKIRLVVASAAADNFSPEMQSIRASFWRPEDY